MIFPFSFFTISTQVMKNAYRSLTSFPRVKRKNFLGASFMKSDLSINNSRVNGIFLFPAFESSGLLIPSTSSTFSSGKFSITTFSGSSTPIKRSAVLFRSSRTEYSSKAMSAVISRFATPTFSAKFRID